MLSQFVTAARGLLSRPESGTPEAVESRPNEHKHEQASAVDEESLQATSQDTMVTATRHSTNLGSPPIAINGKRKTTSFPPDTPEPSNSLHISKRRKKPASADVAANGYDSLTNDTPGRFRVMESVEIASAASTSSAVGSGPRNRKHGVNGKEAASTPSVPVKSTHTRFGSEDPLPQRDGDDQPPIEKDLGKSQEESDDDDDNDDDDAPEAVSNVARLQQLKDAERKRDEARQRHNRIQKDRRREHEKLLQSQAAASKSRRKPLPAEPGSLETQKLKHDEILSESSHTLQGSDVKATLPSAIQSLPALLPDEILNAEPSVRPPTPPRETGKRSKHRTATKPISKKIRFLDEVQKAPKDAKLGNNTLIRVLDEMSHYNSRTGANRSLAPKTAKDSKNVRDGWLLGNRNKDISSSIRRTAGGSTGFVRK